MERLSELTAAVFDIGGFLASPFTPLVMGWPMSRR